MYVHDKVSNSDSRDPRWIVQGTSLIHRYREQSAERPVDR